MRLVDPVFLIRGQAGDVLNEFKTFSEVKDSIVYAALESFGDALCHITFDASPDNPRIIEVVVSHETGHYEITVEVRCPWLLIDTLCTLRENPWWSLDMNPLDYATY